MNRLIFILIITVSLISCEKTENPTSLILDEETKEDTTSLQINFNKRILEGYYVMSIIFDNQGTAWIGTSQQGLIKYNSRETIVYNSENSISALASRIYDIAIDSKNNVWIATADQGLIKYDGTEFTCFNSANTPIPEDFISSIAIDSKDNIWFSSSRFRQGGLVKYDGTNWTVYIPENSDLPVNTVRSILVDRDDNVWLALSETVTIPYLVKISGDKWTIYTSDDFGFKPYFFGNIQMNSKNEVCASIDYFLSSSFANDKAHVFIFDGVSTIQLQLPDSFFGVGIIKVDHQDNIWCGIDRKSVV